MSDGALPSAPPHVNERGEWYYAAMRAAARPRRRWPAWLPAPGVRDGLAVLLLANGGGTPVVPQIDRAEHGVCKLLQEWYAR